MHFPVPFSFDEIEGDKTRKDSDALNFIDHVTQKSRGGGSIEIRDER